jgi:hypothetical protein
MGREDYFSYFAIRQKFIRRSFSASECEDGRSTIQALRAPAF